jgi:hypothetical protein
MALDSIATIWQRLAVVRSLHSQCHSQLQTGWNGEGAGRVCVDSPTPKTLVFKEEGHWQNERGTRFPFRNIYRWTLHPSKPRRIALEHLRFGPQNPVFLLDLVPANTHRLHSHSPHLCGDDRYEATLYLADNTLLFEWTVKGPAKDEHLLYTYQ